MFYILSSFYYSEWFWSFISSNIDKSCISNSLFKSGNISVFYNVPWFFKYKFIFWLMRLYKYSINFLFFKTISNIIMMRLPKQKIKIITLSTFAYSYWISWLSTAAVYTIFHSKVKATTISPIKSWWFNLLSLKPLRLSIIIPKSKFETNNITKINPWLSFL